MYRTSYERLGTNAYGYVTVVNAARVRQTGHVIGDFDVTLYDPSGDDITGDVSITMSEYEVSGSPTGAYRFTVPLPVDGDEGSYTLVVIDPLSRRYTIVFMAYTTLQGDTGDTSAQLELIIRDVDGGFPSAVDISELTVRIYNPSMVESSSSLSPALTELEEGQFLFEFELSSGADEGDWFVDIIDPVRFPQGQQGVWIYYSASTEIPDAPVMNSAVNDETGTSATLDYTAGDSSDVIYTYYRTLIEDDWTLAAQTRTGSGTVQITGLVQDNYEFFAVASRSGSPIINQSMPSNALRVYVYDPSGSQAATDNIKTAKRAMNQKAVYWEPAEIDEIGQPTWNDPVEIECRWSDVQEEFISPDGDRQISRAKLIVDRDLKPKGVVWLGGLDSLVDTDDPKLNEGAWEILQFKKVPDFKGRRYIRLVYV